MPRIRSILFAMAVSNDYLQYVLEQLSGLPNVTSRRMFGGIGLYSDGFFFGLIDNDTVFFKVDDSNRSDYTARGMAAFRPFPDKPDLSMSYFTVPADALEDRDELAAWARKSVTVAIATAKPRRARTPRPKTRRKQARSSARVARPKTTPGAARALQSKPRAKARAKPRSGKSASSARAPRSNKAR